MTAMQETASEGRGLRAAIAAVCGPRGASEFEIDAMHLAIHFAFGERGGWVASGRLDVTWSALPAGCVEVVATYGNVVRMTAMVTPDLRTFGRLSALPQAVLV